MAAVSWNSYPTCRVACLMATHMSKRRAMSSAPSKVGLRQLPRWAARFPPPRLGGHWRGHLSEPPDGLWLFFLPPFDKGADMDRENKKRLIERLHLVWNTGELSLVPQLYSAAFVAHMPKGWERSEFRGHSGVCDAIERVRGAFSGWTETVQDMIIENDKVVTRYVSTGLHTGPFIGLTPTGKRISLDEISIYRLENSLVAEQWCLTDDISLGRQLGRF